MAYSINVAGKQVLVQDGTVEKNATDLTLIGKNYTGFGQALNENFIKLLENFSTDATSPPNAITGQLWYDTTISKLKVYSGSRFVPVSSTTVSDNNSPPINPGIGDMWFNLTTNQLSFWDGSSTILVGPSYTTQQQKSGVVVNSVTAVGGVVHTITCIYNSDALVGFFSNEEFTVQPGTLAGYSPDGVVKIGFNVGVIPGFVFNVATLNSIKLDGYAATEYFKTGRDNYTDHSITIDNIAGLVIKNANLKIEANAVVLENSLTDQPIVMRVKKNAVSENGVVISPVSRTVEIGTSSAPYQVKSYTLPTDQSHLTTKGYVDNTIAATFSVTLKSTSTAADILLILNAMAPANNYVEHAVAKILCTYQLPSNLVVIRVYRIDQTGVWVASPTETVTI
jgi:hypothetical protein